MTGYDPSTMARLDAQTKVETLVAYTDRFRSHGPTSAWAVAKHLGHDPKRAYLWAKNLHLMGILEQKVHEGRLVWDVSRAGHDPILAIRLIGRYGSLPLKGRGGNPTKVKVIGDVLAAARKIEEELQERRRLGSHSTLDLRENDQAH